MNKPSWSQAPEWAQYLAMDADGFWFWYLEVPEPEDSKWMPDNTYELAAKPKRFAELKPKKLNKFEKELYKAVWKTTLERRPNEQTRLEPGPTLG